MKERFHNLQALRGVACLLVILLHLWILEAEFGIQTPVLREFQWFGVAGVDIFFVLSGFLITATNRRLLGHPGAVPGYLFRRVWRIYPAYWAVMGVSFLYFYAVNGAAGVRSGVFDPWPWWAALVPTSGGNALVGQAWTLCYEVMFYLAFGVLILVPPRLAAVALGAWAVTVLVKPVWWTSLAAQHLLSPFVLEFLGGCGVAWLIGRGVRGGWRAALVGGLGYTAVAIIVCKERLIEPSPGGFSSEGLRVLTFGPPAMLLVYAFAAAEDRWPSRVPRGLLRTGDASYSLYLLHPTILALGKWVGVLVPHSRLSHSLWLVGTFAAILAAGFLFHAVVERPLLKLGKFGIGRLYRARLAIRLPALGPRFGNRA